MLLKFCFLYAFTSCRQFSSHYMKWTPKFMNDMRKMMQWSRLSREAYRVHQLLCLMGMLTRSSPAMPISKTTTSTIYSQYREKDGETLICLFTILFLTSYRVDNPFHRWDRGEVKRIVAAFVRHYKLDDEDKRTVFQKVTFIPVYLQCSSMLIGGLINRLARSFGSQRWS